MNSVQVYESSGNVFVRFSFQLDTRKPYYFRHRCSRNEPLGRTLERMSLFYKKMLEVEAVCLRSASSRLLCKQHESKRPYSAASASASASASTSAQDEAAASTPTPAAEVSVKLLNLGSQEVPAATRAWEAWRENFRLLAAGREFPVQVNVPHVKSLELSRTLMVNMPALVAVETDRFLPHCENNMRFFKYKWYYSRRRYEDPASLFFQHRQTSTTTKRARDQDDIDAAAAAEQQHSASSNSTPSAVEDARNEWVLFDEGVNRRTCFLDEATRHRLIKCVCIPSDGSRDGAPIASVSTSTVQAPLELPRLPMTERHELTKERLDANHFRVISYNILSKFYADNRFARNELYPYCSHKFLDFSYRRVLLLHEITKYNADIVFLQECDQEFFEHDLRLALPDYVKLFRPKVNLPEGEAVLVNSRRFRLVRMHSAVLGDELKSKPVYRDLLRRLDATESLGRVLRSKGTVVQLVHVELADDPQHHMLLANTHLFYGPEHDFSRCVQSMLCLGYIESVRAQILARTPHVRHVDVLFAGDMNSDEESNTYAYLTGAAFRHDALPADQGAILRDFGAALFQRRPLALATHVCKPFTHCQYRKQTSCDYIFFEPEAFELKRVVPVPAAEKLRADVAIPSRFCPSDHVAVVFELERRRLQQQSSPTTDKSATV